jgi:hypothetical protein
LLGGTEENHKNSIILSGISNKIQTQHQPIGSLDSARLSLIEIGIEIYFLPMRPIAGLILLVVFSDIGKVMNQNINSYKN